MSKEAMKLALEAFDALRSHGDIAVLVTPEREFNFSRISKELRQAIAEAEKQPKREPLTDEQIEQIYRAVDGNEFPIDFCREIEAAHGIKGEA